MGASRMTDQGEAFTVHSEERALIPWRFHAQPREKRGSPKKGERGPILSRAKSSFAWVKKTEEEEVKGVVLPPYEPTFR